MKIVGIIVGGLIVLGIVGSILGRLARFPLLVFFVAAIVGLAVGISNDTVWGGIGAGFGVLMLFGMGAAFLGESK